MRLAARLVACAASVSGAAASPAGAAGSSAIAAAAAASRPKRALSTRTPPIDTLGELQRRGLVNDTTNAQGLARLLASKPTNVYAGFDPTAPSLHVGNLLMLVTMMHFQLTGHQVYALVGGATGSIGDPSGKSTERNALDKATLDTNVAAIEAQIKSVLDNAAKYAAKRLPQGSARPDLLPARIVNNRDWFQAMTILEFIGHVGRRARISSMLARDSVKSRLGSPEGLSFTEFTYQLLQAYDFWYLFRNHGCQVQIGGSDQWGNITAGTELIRKYVSDGADVQHPDAKAAVSLLSSHADATPAQTARTDDLAYGVTIPLVTTATGEKFGKSAGNAVWLDESMVSAFDFYQFFRRTPDSHVGRYLSYFTLLSKQRIDSLIEMHEASALGSMFDTLTCIIELAEAKAARAQTKSAVLYDDALDQTTAEEILAAFENDPRLRKIARAECLGRNVCEFVTAVEATKSKSAARKLVASGGLYLNKRRVSSDAHAMAESDLIGGSVCLVRTGKSNYVVVHVQ
nr:tyrosyl-tRNA synthetase [Polyrhizophydium stewartii]